MLSCFGWGAREITTTEFGGTEQQPHHCLTRRAGTEAVCGRRGITHGGSRGGWGRAGCPGTALGPFPPGGWQIPRVPSPLKGATGGGARALEEQVGVSFWSTLGRAGPEQLAHLALRNSRSHLPGTCPRAHGSRVAPGSQSPQTIGQQVFWGGTPGQHPLASPDGPVQVREDCP